MFTEFGKTSIPIKQNPIIFVQHLSFLSDKNFQTVGQLSSNYPEDFAKSVTGSSKTYKVTLAQIKLGIGPVLSGFILDI